MARSAEFYFKEAFLAQLVEAVPGILQSQDPETGRFGRGIWIVGDQHVMFPLAVAWATKSSKNPYHQDPKLLSAIMAAGDALIDSADSKGQWDFLKKNGENWGKIHMPWTYSRWIRSYALIKDAMPPDRRQRWTNALVLGFSGISKTCLTSIQNIPAHHAMALYIAGKTLDRPEWCTQAAAFLHKVAGAQDPGGFWSENYGPVVLYNAVYIDALGTYFAWSDDKSIIPYLKRAALFHSNFTYPDGRSVETIDERNFYDENLRFGNIGLSLTAEGRGVLARQLSLQKKHKMFPPIDDIAMFILNGEEGPMTPTAGEETNRKYVMNNKAMIQRKGPWFICCSAYCCPVSKSRWIQDRQNFVSVYHDKCSLVVGGGNTKLQPLWSSFTVGDTALLRHKPGDTRPNFVPAGPLQHIPSVAKLRQDEPIGIDLNYGSEQCEIRVNPIDDRTLKLYVKSTANATKPVEGHITLRPDLSSPFKAGSKITRDLNTSEFKLTGAEISGWIEHNGWRLSIPENAKVVWPVLPHYPYAQDGSCKKQFGRIVVALPFSTGTNEYSFTLIVP